jgi:hypothetical protein
MAYAQTKLSTSDTEILQEIYRELECITLPRSFRHKAESAMYHIKRTGTYGQQDARQACFGQVTYQHSLRETNPSKRNPHIMPLFRKFMASHRPDFLFTSVFVNKNTTCQRHTDSKNTGESLIVGCGNYTGGETILHLEKAEEFDISSHSLVFNGVTIPHESRP